ncbi:hypothetical protein Pen01_78330 [Phytomonospora endophytica]|nr:hypothetical protein Pen01_78330 [Phytomonospora endophytica]
MECLVCGSDNRPRRPRFQGERPEFQCVHCLALNFQAEDGSWAHQPYRSPSDRWPAGSRRRGNAEERRREHAVADEATLCGLPEAAITLYRHLWSATAAASCADCVASAQEVDGRWPTDLR